MSKKAQGLSFNVIVMAIIALFILILLVAWLAGAFGKIFTQTKAISEATDADITAAQTKCAQLCIVAHGARDVDTWKKSTYCSNIFTGRDWSNPPDGQIDELKCWQPPIGIACSIEVDGETITEAQCL